jgi:dihydrofolate reductase
VPAHGDEDVIAFVDDLKGQPGADIHLSGGARLAQTLARLALVDRYHLVVHPVFSKGAQWFDGLDEQRTMELLSARTYSNGVVGLHTRRGRTD